MELTGSINEKKTLSGTILRSAGGGGGGTSNYNDLSNKPQINSVTLSGNKTASDLGLVSESDFEEAINGVLALSSTLVPTLSNGSDFNTLMDGGSYKIGSASALATMSNTPPTTDAGRLIIFQSSAATRLFQFYVTNGSSCRIYFRWYGSTATWSAWKSLANSDDISTLSNAVAALNDSRTHAMPFTISETGKYINYSTGATGTGTNYDYTDYVDVSACSSIIYRRAQTTVSSTTVGLAFYDSTKTVISNSGERIVSGQDSIGYAGLKELAVPSGAVYARFTTIHDTTTYGDFELYGLYKTPVVDSELSSTSTNAVQNKVVTAALDRIFIAQYGVTSYAEIIAALTAGKFVFAYDSGTPGQDACPLLAMPDSWTGDIYFCSPVLYNSSDGVPRFKIFRVEWGTATWSTFMSANLVCEGDISPYSSLPASNGTAYAGASSAYARGDHVHPTDTSRLAANQGSANAGKFLVVGSDGNVTTMTLSTWQGGSY